MAHVVQALVRFGPWPKFAGMRGVVRSSVPIYNKLNGEAIFVKPLTITLDKDGYTEQYLPFTDRDVNSTLNFDYEISWVSGYAPSPPARKFRLPSAVHEVHYIALVQSSTVPGVFVPLEPAPVAPAPAPSSPAPAPSSPASNVLISHAHVQSTPAASWLIDHSLNRKPSVALVVGGKLVLTDVEYPSNSRVTVLWPVPTVGEAHLS